MPVPPPGFLRGLGVALRGLRLVNTHRQLWTWVVLPMVVSAVLLGVFIALGLAWADTLTPELANPWWSWIDWLRVGLAAVLPVLVNVVIIAAALTITVMLSSLVNAPFLDLLSEKAENAHLGRPDTPRPWSALVPDLWRSMMAALYLLGRQAAVLFVLFLLSFTAVGAPLFVAAGFYFTGFGLLDVTLSRKRYPGKTRSDWARRHWDLLTGMGVLANLLPMLTPFGVVGATLVYLDHPDKG